MGILSVACPRCEAKVGKPCNNGTLRSRRSLPCSERRDAYKLQRAHTEAEWEQQIEDDREVSFE